MRVLVVNAGSSTVKLALLDATAGTEEVEPRLTRELAAPRAQLDPTALHEALAGELGQADAVGHRIVHGGERFREPLRVDQDVRRALEALVDLAPLHQPKSLSALDAVSEVLPALPAVACFDTAFHATLPRAASTYALPARWRERFGLRRYGFHGLSHAWVARRVPILLAADAQRLRIVSCHLGAGASLCAIRAGRSLDTTMGFTPLEGLVMATRSGSVDPGMLLWLLERSRLNETELAHTLEHESGLLGLGGTADMRQILARARAGDDAAELALEVYLHRLCGAVAAMAASLGGLDVLAFTGGVGEHAADVRAAAVQRLAFFGLTIDPDLNRRADGDADVSLPESGPRVVVLKAREDVEIARQTAAVLMPSLTHRAK